MDSKKILKDLFVAYYDARKNKRNSKSVLSFEIDYERKLLELGQANNTQVHHFPDIDLFDDLDSVLSLVNACDVVLSSSNTIAHLAGALGKRTILIVPYETGKFWYWHEINHHSLWYPSIRVFTQKKQGDWSDVMSEVFDFMGSLSFDR